MKDLVFVIVRDDADRLVYFVHVGLGGALWHGSHNADDARTFDTRQEASTVLTRNGKHRHGWRVVREAR